MKSGAAFGLGADQGVKIEVETGHRIRASYLDHVLNVALRSVFRRHKSHGEGDGGADIQVGKFGIALGVDRQVDLHPGDELRRNQLDIKQRAGAQVLQGDLLADDLPFVHRHIHISLARAGHGKNRDGRKQLQSSGEPGRSSLRRGEGDLNVRVVRRVHRGRQPEVHWCALVRRKTGGRPGGLEVAGHLGYRNLRDPVNIQTIGPEIDADAAQGQLRRIDQLDREIQVVILRHADVAEGGGGVDAVNAHGLLRQHIKHIGMSRPDGQLARETGEGLVTVTEIAVAVSLHILIPHRAARREADAHRDIALRVGTGTVNGLAADDNRLVSSEDVLLRAYRAEVGCLNHGTLQRSCQRAGNTLGGGAEPGEDLA